MPIDPVAALREIAYLMERNRSDAHRVRAFRHAAAVIAALPETERERIAASDSWRELPGLGASTATVAAQAASGRVPDRLAELLSKAGPLTDGGAELLARLRGDLHSHTDASDGTVSLAEMVAAAAALGREYLAITDHSPRLRVANGLSAERLAAQLDQIEELNRASGTVPDDSEQPIRVLKGIEVDILADGRLDQSPALLDRLDVVVASAHSNLRMPGEQMTMRLVAAIANPRTNVLGHCTGRLITGSRGTRPGSDFDAEVVFEACRHFDVAVEINSRPERCDPPDDLLALAFEAGCRFAINSDAHAPGQLEFLAYGAARAEGIGIPPERIVTTWPVAELLSWANGKRRNWTASGAGPRSAR